MKDQTELQTIAISIDQDDQAGAFNRAGVQAPIYFAEDDFAEELAAESYKINLNCRPGTMLSPEIEPDEFESVYLWFFS